MSTRPGRVPGREQVPRALAETGVVRVLGVNDELVSNLACGTSSKPEARSRYAGQAPALLGVRGDFEVLIGDVGPGASDQPPAEAEPARYP